MILKLEKTRWSLEKFPTLESVYAFESKVQLQKDVEYTPICSDVEWAIFRVKYCVVN